jgi:hypothetical protein
MFGTVATLKAAGSTGFELSASFIDTALILAGVPDLGGSFPESPAGVTMTLEVLSE